MEEHKSRAAPKCATCKHYGRNLKNKSMATPAGCYVYLPMPYCHHQNTPVDLVTGRNETWAADMRRLDSKCGESGAWYEREEPITPENKSPTLESVINAPTSKPMRKWWQFWS